MEIEDLKGDYIAGKPIVKYLRYYFRITQKRTERFEPGGGLLRKKIRRA